jgi:hemoglobin
MGEQMRASFRWRPAALAAGLAVALLSAAYLAAGPDQPHHEAPAHKGLDKQLYDSLRTVINTGADYFNVDKDYRGCYRLFEGSLIAARPLLGHHPDLQKEIDRGLADAKSMTNDVDRAFALRRVLDNVRKKLEPAGVPTKDKVTDKKPTDVKPDDKKPTDVKPTDVKPPRDKKPTDVKPTDVKPTDVKPTDVKPDDKKPTDVKPTDKKPPKVKIEPKPTLWERLGGVDKVTQAVDDFMAAVAADKRVDFTRGGKYKFDAKQLKHLRKGLIDMISQVSGGPFDYTGPDMKKVHAGMRITNREFDLSAEHFKKALEKAGAEPKAIAELMGMVESTREEIVEANGNGKKPPEKKDTDKKPDDVKPLDKKGGDREKVPVPPEGAGGAASVEGKVTYKGRPLTEGKIEFVPPDGKRLSAPVQPDGTYRLEKGAAPGKYRVVIQTQAGKDAVRIPARYADPATSGLIVEVRPGRNNLDIELSN